MWHWYCNLVEQEVWLKFECMVWISNRKIYIETASNWYSITCWCGLLLCWLFKDGFYRSAATWCRWNSIELMQANPIWFSVDFISGCHAFCRWMPSQACNINMSIASCCGWCAANTYLAVGFYYGHGWTAVMLQIVLFCKPKPIVMHCIWNIRGCELISSNYAAG